ncbi:MAG: class II fructose-bisphosphate aldolase [bacterium]|nr:class II fructose-bisphosphate aldolase [bacterium]
MSLFFSEILKNALAGKWSTGHFNISNLEQMRAICQAAFNLKSPVIIGTSEGERKYIGLFEAVSLRDAFRKEFGMPIFLNADHSKSVEAAKVAVDAGYDSIHIDLSALSYEDNVAGTAEVVRYAKSKNPEINVEGELGILKGESKIQKEIIEVKPEELTTPDEAADFVKRTGIDRLAPAVGNIHGISANKKIIYPDLIRRIREAIPENVGLTLHGGSGISDDQISGAIEAGVNNIHINTEIRVADTEALKKSLASHPEETTPYKISQPVIDAVREKVEEKLKLFGSINRI